MKLCYVGSLESVHTKRWVRYFAERGHDVHLVSPLPYVLPQVPSYQIENVKVHTFKILRTRIGFLTILLNLLIIIPRVLHFRGMIKRIDPDLLHVHYINDVALFTVLTGFRPCVVTAWGSDVLVAPTESKIVRWMVGFILRKADLVTCDAEHMKEALVGLGAKPSKVHIIFFGTDTESFHPLRRDPGLRKRLGLAGSPVVISIRRLDPIYDLGCLIKAAALVLAKVPCAKFLIAGTGSEAERLKLQADSLGILESVQFVGQLFEEELPRYLASADIYVSTALSDAGLAASTAEAMASGLPVVIADVAANRYWLEDGVSGFLVPARNPEVLALRLIHLAEHKGERKRLGHNGRQMIVNRNNWIREMTKMGHLYQGLIRDQRHDRIRQV